MGRFFHGILLLSLTLHLPIQAQDDPLLGSWELHVIDEDGEETTRVTLAPDGSFEISGEAQPSGDLFGDAEDVEGLGFEVFPPVELMEIQGTGTWHTVGDSLYMDIVELEILIDGVEIEQWFTDVGKDFARNLADLNGIPDEAYPAFEEEVVQQFLTGLEEEPLSETFDQAGTFVIEDNELQYTLTDDEGSIETDLYQRMPIVSAVGAATWGQIKTLRLR